MKLHLFQTPVFILLSSMINLNAQQQLTVISIKMKLANAKTAEEKVYFYDKLALLEMNVNPRDADSIGRELILFAEETRDRKLMIKAYMSNGQR